MGRFSPPALPQGQGDPFKGKIGVFKAKMKNCYSSHCIVTTFLKIWSNISQLKVRKVLHWNFLDRTTFSIHQTKKTSILSGLLEIAWKFFLPINFWFFNENQSNLLVFSPLFQESPPFGHLSVKRATLFRAFFILFIFTFFGNNLDFLPCMSLI